MTILKPFKWLWKHKFVTLVLLVVIVAGGYFAYKKTGQSENTVEYITATVEKGMLISSISGTGQVSSSNQVDIKPKVSGDIITVAVTNGQKIKKGDLIAQIDSRDASISISEAKASYENAKLDLDELLAPVDNYTLLQIENSLADAQDSLAKLKFNQEQEYSNIIEDLDDAYEDAYNEITDTFLDLPDIMTSVDTTLFSDEIADSEYTVQQGSNNTALINAFSSSDSDEKLKFEYYLDDSEDKYHTVDDSYDINFDNYREASRYSDRGVIEALLDETVETVKQISDTIKSSTNMLDFWVGYRSDKGFSVYSKVTQYQSNLTSDTSKANSHLTSLLSVQRSIEDAKVAIEELKQNQPLDLAASQRSLKEKEEKLADLLAGATELEIKNKELTVQQKYNSLINAQQNWSDYRITAPFDGIIASLDVAVGDSVGSSNAVATIITDQKIAEVTLNEIDAAQVVVGQRVTLEFDAVSDLSVTGEVVEVDAIGTVNQGVVSYNVKIAFDVQDDRVKSGMSASANIITQSKQGVLLAPITAVKTVGNSSYVEILVNGQPQRQTVTTGDSDDTRIEIIDGLSEGQEIVTQTTGGTTATVNSAGSNSQPDMGGMMRAFR